MHLKKCKMVTADAFCIFCLAFWGHWTHLDHPHCRRTPILSTTVSRHHRIHSPSQNLAKTKLYMLRFELASNMPSSTVQRICTSVRRCAGCLRILGKINTKQPDLAKQILKHYCIHLLQCIFLISFCHGQPKMICQGKFALGLCPQVAPLRIRSMHCATVEAKALNQSTCTSSAPSPCASCRQVHCCSKDLTVILLIITGWLQMICSEGGRRISFSDQEMLKSL